ncbi:MAG: hypothetical protein O3A00_23630 [Planctomycetota bacterium]|nr:hypothetical protein [Planctomycetota bacterium]
MFRSPNCWPSYSMLALIAVTVGGCGKVPTWSEITGKSKTDEESATKTTAATDQVDTVTPPDASQPGQSPPSTVGQNPGQNPPPQTATSTLKAAVTQRFGSLDKCQALNLAGSNALSPDILNDLKDLPTLEHLILNGRPLNSAAMQAVGNVKTLKSLYLDGATFSPFDLERIALLDNLRHLNVSRTQVSDQALALIKHLPLEILQVQNCGGVHGEWFTAKGRDKWFGGGLKMIEADKSRFGDWGFVYVNGSADLEVLMATQAGVEDGRLTGLARCKNLRVLSLRENPISDFGAKELMKLQNLEAIDIFADRLTEATLASLKGLKKLKRMNPAPLFSEQALQFFRTKFNPDITYGEIGTFEAAAGLTGIHEIPPLIN